MSGPITPITPSMLRPLLRRELKNFLSDDEPIEKQFLSFRTIRNKLEVQTQPNALFAQRLAINGILSEIVDELYKGEKELAEIIRRRFFEKGTIKEVAQEFHLGEATVSRRQEEGLDKIASAFYDLEIKARDEWFHRLETHLPSQPYAQLIGVEETLNQLMALIDDPNGPTIITLVGIGGIGKSSLADALTRRSLRTGRFQRPAWLYFERESPFNIGDYIGQSTGERFISQLAQQLMPNDSALTIEKQAERLRARLKMAPHLITIDNLEQKEETNEILRYLGGLGSPTRFIVTTRVQPDETNSYVHPLGELSRSESFELLAFLLKSSGLDPSGSVDEAVIESIYQMVGGNPLALKIVVGLLRRLPLDQILADLEKGRGNARLIYHGIFRKTWETISHNGKILLQTMPLVSTISGASPDQMRSACGLPEEAFWQAVAELTLHSMLEVRGTLSDRRYGIHQLTESFLSSDVLGGEGSW